MTNSQDSENRMLTNLRPKKTIPLSILNSLLVGEDRWHCLVLCSCCDPAPSLSLLS